MRKLNVGIDLDGPCYQFVKALREFLVAHRGYSLEQLRSPGTSWNFYSEGWGLSLEEFITECDNAVDRGHLFAMGDPTPGALHYLSKIKEDGHNIIIVTARQFGTKSQINTAKWLQDWKIKWDAIGFSEDKTLLPTDIFIDDKPANVDALRAAGTEAWVFKTGLKAQEGHPYLLGEERDPIGQWAAFYEKVKEMACR